MPELQQLVPILPAPPLTPAREAGIVFIDVVAFTRLMEKDAEKWHATWTKLKRGPIAQFVHSNGGRVVKSTGDGLLIEFETSTAAVEFALDLQRHQAPKCGGIGAEDVLQIRTSVNYGPVFSDEADIYGDDVNIAARLLDFVTANEIAVTARSLEMSEVKRPLQRVDLGFLTLRNLERRVRTYKISGSEISITPSQQRRAHAPSIAVLPFETPGRAPDDRFIAVGLLRGLITALSSLHELFVISASSTQAYTSTGFDPLNVRHVLGVRYVVTGSISTIGAIHQVTVELCDTDDRTVIWSESTSFDAGDIARVQQKIAEDIATKLVPWVRHAELRASHDLQPQNLDAYHCLLRGIHSLSRLTPDSFADSKRWFNEALSRDPGYSQAYTAMAHWYILYVGEGRSPEPDADSLEALNYSSKALDFDDADPLALAIFGHVNSFMLGRYDQAIAAFDKATTFCPGSAMAWGLSAPTYCYIGQPKEAISRARRALSLSPIEPFGYFYRTALTLAFYFAEEHDDAVYWGARTMGLAPRFMANLRILIPSLVALGRMDEAKKIAQHLLDCDPSFQVDRFVDRYPLVQISIRELLRERLSAAGLK